MEEICSYEEAREVFENHHQTARFWTQYYDGDQCESAPCGNGGNCTDLVGGFLCLCPAPFYGLTCELGPESRPETGSDPDFADVVDSAPQLIDPAVCQTSGPSSCEQLCTASEFSFSCSCLTGFKLQSDGRHCEPEVEFPCGQIPDQLLSNSSHYLCTNHKCPWEVTILDWRGVQLCWGALLGHSLVLTSAHCLHSQLGPDLDPNQIFIRFSGQRRVLQVRSVEVHERFSLARHDYDLALLQTSRPVHLGPTLFHLCVPAYRDHAENVLMHTGKLLLVGGCGSGARSLTLDECRRHNVSHGLTNKMFCLETTWTEPGLNQNQNQRTKPEPGQEQDWALDRTTDHRPGAKEDTDRRQNRGGVTQNGRQRTSNSRHQTEPDVDQTGTRTRAQDQTVEQTTDQDQSHDPRRQSRSRNNQNNKEADDIEAQHGRRQEHKEGQVQNRSNTSQTGPNQDKQKVHPHQDQPRLNQDRPKPTKPRPNQDQQWVDLDLTPTGPDQHHLDPPGLNQNQTGVDHILSKPSQTGQNQDKQRVSPHQDQPGLNQNKTKVHSHQHSPGLNQNYQNTSGLAQARPQTRPAAPGLAQARPQTRSTVPGLFWGAPVVSVDQGTAYLVGLLTSTAPAGGSTHILVFTKLSRHMTWLQQRLSHMTPPPQVIHRP